MGWDGAMDPHVTFRLIYGVEPLVKLCVGGLTAGLP